MEMMKTLKDTHSVVSILISLEEDIFHFLKKFGLLTYTKVVT